ncbi:MAG: bifunctional folylpolyglutamate synthase/dihydrofolate synthase [Peptococcaceae bacterium]|jgi:dihydrofolate synthase/folylpolyglutamate synthase|nr:bifunctional folylpolyglutamate synthase/dihydrofolate synthase [Peptococcaceae bacterium]
MIKELRETTKKGQDQEYTETLDFIRNLTKFGINLGLARIQELLHRLNNPERKIRVIHIGGTNGKGSTTAILLEVLAQAGYRVGMFSSPHLHDYRERIRINHELISPAELVACMGVIRPVLEEMLAEGLEPPTEFEVSTALALYYFAQKQPDFVLLEVGLGGEIDSTNVVQPYVTVLTSIGMDHMNYLGNTLAEITRVKTGIIKQGVPVVTSAERPEVLKIIKEVAKEKASRLVIVRKQDSGERKLGSGVASQETEDRMAREVWALEAEVSKNTFDYFGLKWEFKGLELGLLGRHQFSNAAAALAVCEVLEDVAGTLPTLPGTLTKGVKITEKAVRQGLKKVKWPARLELTATSPKILLDGAHNVDGINSLVQALTDYGAGLLKYKRLVLCLGMLSDKEVEKAMDILGPMADEIFVTKPDSPRAGQWEQIAGIALKYLAPEKIHTVEDPILAVQEGLKLVGPEDMLLVTGSLYMIAEARKYLLGCTNFFQ